MALHIASNKVFGAVAGGQRSRRATAVVCRAQAKPDTRRRVMQQAASLAAAAALIGSPLPAMAGGLPPQTFKMLCDEECSAKLEAVEAVTTPSGLQYKDIIVGTGPKPPIGFQVVSNYVAMTPTLRVFESSLEKGKPYTVRVGAGQIIAGLDEGLLSMQPGGLRRLYIPGNLAFPKGLKAAAGRPSVPPSTPVVFDVQLLYIPGLEDE